MVEFNYLKVQKSNLGVIGVGDSIVDPVLLLRRIKELEESVVALEIMLAQKDNRVQVVEGAINRILTHTDCNDIREAYQYAREVMHREEYYINKVAG